MEEPLLTATDIPPSDAQTATDTVEAIDSIMEAQQQQRQPTSLANNRNSSTMTDNPPSNDHHNAYLDVILTYCCNTTRPRSTPPQMLFPLFILINLSTMADRGIIPGASREFSAFCVAASDSPNFVRNNPDAGIGLLQAAFIGGYSVAILISGHLVHKIRWKVLVAGGLCIWILAVGGSGLSRTADSFYMLLSSRMLTGVSEASFHVVAPPMMQDRGGTHSGLWLSLYLTAIPIGLAIGYVYGSIISNHSGLGWQWAFYIECFLAIPLLIGCLLVRDFVNGGILPSSSQHGMMEKVDGAGEGGTIQSEEEERTGLERFSDEGGSSASGLSLAPPETSSSFTMWAEIRACMSSRVLLCVIFANAALIAVVATLGTFGGAFILALELFDDEQTAAIVFGIAAATAGIIGTPLGGHLVDQILGKYSPHESSMEILSSLLPIVNILIVIGTIFCLPTIFVTNAYGFLIFLFLGWLFFFGANSGITMSIMLAVDPGYRSNALAFATLMMHLLGDVPAPIAFGALKDHLAPACTVNADGEVENRDECQEQHWGLRATLAVAYGWMIWGILFFELGRRRARYECSTGGGVEELRSGGGSSEEQSSFVRLGSSSRRDTSGNDASVGSEDTASMFLPVEGDHVKDRYC